MLVVSSAECVAQSAVLQPEELERGEPQEGDFFYEWLQTGTPQGVPIRLVSSAWALPLNSSVA